MKVNICRIDQSLPLPQYETKGSFAFDLLARETVIIAPQTLELIPGNVIIKCPNHLALKILPRSSTFRKKSLIFPHSVGLIDADYCGPDDEIMIQVFNFGKDSITVARGEKIAQGIFLHTERVEFNEITTAELGQSRGGFGSTDNK